MVSLESPSNVEYGIKKIFSIVAFSRQLSRSKSCVNIRRNSAVFFTFLTKFSSILTKFASILLKYLKIVNCCGIDFISKDRGG